MDPKYLTEAEPFFTTELELVRAKLAALELKDGEVIVDMGSGVGHCLTEACAMANVKAIGYEILPEALEQAYKNIEEAGFSDRIEIREFDFLQADLSQVDAVILYLTRAFLGHLSIKLEEELPSGARIVTHLFDLPGWEAEKEIDFTSSKGKQEKIYLYRQP